MKTTDDIRKALIDELRALLVKYNATLSTEDHYQGYPECGEDVRMTVMVPAIYSPEGETLSEFTEIDLGREIN